MANNNTINKLKVVLVLVIYLVCIQFVQSQETVPVSVDRKNAYHNQLYFNRFLINPTFSLVRETKSYINVLHRNQYAAFQDNKQNYVLGFSNKLNDRTALGISIYSQWAGVVQEFGFNANYATSVKLGDKSALTFGTNVIYYTEGLDKNRVVGDVNDPSIQDATKESKLAIKPGVTLSLGQFDFGLYADNLFNYNQTANEFETNLGLESVKASVQYTYQFLTKRGMFANARILPMVQVGKNTDGGVNYAGSLLLDLPSYAWLQGNYDADYGLSLGLGFNLSKRMSLGYLLEKDVQEKTSDFGWNHEVSLAYTLDTYKSGADGIAEASVDAKIDKIIRNYEEQIIALTDRLNKTETGKRGKIDAEAINDVPSESEMAYENRMLIDELIIRQDSIENARNLAFDNKLQSLVEVLRAELREKDAIINSANASTAVAATVPEKALENNATVVAVSPAKQKTEANSTNTVTKTVPKTANEVKTNAVAEVTPVTQRNEAAKTAYLKAKALKALEYTEAIAENKVAEPEAHSKFKELPTRVFSQASFDGGAKSGFYVIANVFSVEKYLNSFMADLKKKGLDPKKFYNKATGLHYVYLAGYNYRDEAESAFVSNLDGKYNDEKWILQIDQTAVADTIFEDEIE